MPSALANRWGLGERSDLGSMNTLVSLFRVLDVSSPWALPDLYAASRLLLASDYGGQHASARGEVYAYLLVDRAKLGMWWHAREHLRSARGLGRRRMAFKALGDRTRRQALPAFLAAADNLDGLLFVVRVSKRVGTLFNEDSKIDPLLAEKLARWSPKTVERLLRVCHFGALMLSGLSRPGQDVLWVTDQDDIAANVERHRTMTDAFGTICSHYLEHSLGHLQVATAASDTGQRDLEDLIGLTDLAAGTACQVLDAYDNVEWPVPGLVVPTPVLPEKTRKLMAWLADDRPPLKRLVVSIEPGSTPEKMRFRQFKFVTSESFGKAPEPSELAG